MPTFPPENAGMTRRDERQVEAQIGVRTAAEDDFALVDLDLRLAVHGEVELLRRRLAFLALARRGRVQRHAGRDRRRVSGQRPLDYLARHQAGAFGEALDQLPVLVAELERGAPGSLSCCRGTGLSPQGLLRHAPLCTTGKRPMPLPARRGRRM